MKKVISFCIPCYRSKDTIIPVINEIIEKVNQKENEYDYEIVAVVDGSPDNVYEVLQNVACKNEKIKIADFSKNFGQASARMATINYATGDYIVCLDDDGQCPIDKLWELINPLENGKDVSIANYPKKKQSAFKNFGSSVNIITQKILLDTPKDFKMSNFYAMKKFVAKQVIKYSNPYPYMTGLLVQITNNFELVEMEERERASGSTGYTFKKLISLWMNGFTNFSVKPLRISSLIGAMCAFAGFIFGIVTIIRKLIVPNISAGWSSTVSILLFIGGLIMLMLGMIGEYIGRIFICINDAPQYVIKETVNIKEELSED